MNVPKVEPGEVVEIVREPKAGESHARPARVLRRREGGLLDLSEPLPDKLLEHGPRAGFPAQEVWCLVPHESAAGLDPAMPRWRLP